jgi:beta-xylosidase
MHAILMVRLRRLQVLLLLLVTAAAATPDARHQEPPLRYLFSYFTGNGEDGLHLAASADGLRWTALREGASFLQPSVGSKLMRDPSIVQGPDGTFHMVWTTGWWDAGIGVAHSRDLISWSEQQFIPVMKHEPTALNAWAPELYYDETAREYLIFWASTVPGRFPDTEESGDLREDGQKLNHRMYFVTTTDFQTYSPTRLFYDGGFNAIDGTIVRHDRDFVMIVKDETKRPTAKKNLRVARAPRAGGPYGPVSPPISVDWVEGPTILKVGESWIVYYDEYTRKRYGAMRSSDLRTWTVISDQLRFPEGTRHGTAFAVSEAVIKRLQETQPN